MNRASAGRVALVTGAGAGIGRATAVAFADDGARVVASDVTEDAGQSTVDLIRETGGEAIFVRCDVSEDEEVQALIARTLDAYGRLDAAFNNAGVEGALAPTAEYSVEDWDRVMAVNLKGVWLCMRSEIRAMLRQGGGAIVNNASILGHVAFPNTPAYTASKHGVIGVSRAAALDYAAQRIRINVVSPAIIETPMVMERGLAAGASQEKYDQLAGLHPMNRLGRPEEIASAVLWLCSEGASFVTGHSLLVDGGFTLR
jgi:NAD(P)-dependent dehydrogenase (short-subunit alcohol dehydrogenase family)